MDCFIKPSTSCNLSKQSRPWSDVLSGSALFANAKKGSCQFLAKECAQYW